MLRGKRRYVCRAAARMRHALPDWFAKPSPAVISQPAIVADGSMPVSLPGSSARPAMPVLMRKGNLTMPAVPVVSVYRSALAGHALPPAPQVPVQLTQRAQLLTRVVCPRACAAVMARMMVRVMYAPTIRGSRAKPQGRVSVWMKLRIPMAIAGHEHAQYRMNAVPTAPVPMDFAAQGRSRGYQKREEFCPVRGRPYCFRAIGSGHRSQI